MRTIEVYHHNFNSAGTHTFELQANPKYEILIKNLTEGNISVSFGTEIDTTNDSYIYMLKKTAETLQYKAKGNNNPVFVTVSAESTGLVELRILDDD